MNAVYRVILSFLPVLLSLLLIQSCQKEKSKGLETKLEQSNTIAFLLTGISEEKKITYCMFGFLLPDQRKLGLFYINPLISFKPDEPIVEELGVDANRLIIPYIESITDLKVNYSLSIKENDFSKIVDLLGGIEFYFDPTVPIRSEVYQRKPGENLMFGREVLDFFTMREGEVVDVYIDRQNLQQSVFLSLYDRLRTLGELRKEWIYFFEKAFQSSLSGQELYSLYQYILKEHIIFSISELPGEVVVDEKTKKTSLLVKTESARIAFEKLVNYLNSGDYGYGELARTEVLNSTEQNGLAKNVRSILNEQSIKVLTVGNGWNQIEKKSIVIDRSGNPEFSYRIAKFLGIPTVYHIIDKDLGLDTTVLLGEDFEIKTRK